MGCPLSAEKLIRAAQQDPVWWIREVLGVEPWSVQEEIAYSVRDHKYTCVQSGHNVGKLLTLSEYIPNASGRSCMGEIRVGDTVFDETGKPCTVTWKSEPTTPEAAYRLTFADGTSIEACSEHQWYAESDQERRRRGRYGEQQPGKVRTTQELYDGNTTPKRGKYMWSIPKLSAPVQYPEVDLPLDPYVLGVWLGDGTRGAGTITNLDDEVWRQLEGRGFSLSSVRQGKHRTVYGLIGYLKRLGIERSKEVPEPYLRASVEQRLDLLRGLLDTDGTCGTSGRVSFCSTDKHLADAVFRLAASLGFRPNRPHRNESKLYGERKKDRYRVTFMADIPCFYIKRKAERQKPGGQRSMHHMIVSIEPCEPKPMQCISVDSPRNLYLCSDAYIPTHNTFITACICLWFHCCFPDSVVLTTANGWGQVKGVLWEEIRKLARRAKYPLGITFKPKHPESRVGENNWMFGFSPDKPDSVHGHHRDHILIVFDEAQGIQENHTWDAFSSMMTSSGARQLAIGNPIYPYGPFRQRFKDPNWSRIRVSCLDHPNYTLKRQIVPGALTYESIEEIKQDPLRGPGTLYWDTRIDGVFPSIGDDNLLPESFLTNCLNLPSFSRLLPGRYIGFDPASYGNDRSVCCVMIDGRVVAMDSWRNAHPLESVKRVLKIALKYGVPQCNINYDAIGGVGGAIKKAFLAAKVPAHAVYVGQEPVGDWEYLFAGDATLQFINRRAELHWAMRRLFEDRYISVKPDFYQKLVVESCELRYGFMDNGKLYIESKDKKFRPRMGYSPDNNDALVLALARDQKLDPGNTFSGADIKDRPEKIDPTGMYGPNTEGRRRRRFDGD